VKGTSFILTPKSILQRNRRRGNDIQLHYKVGEGEAGNIVPLPAGTISPSAWNPIVPFECLKFSPPNAILVLCTRNLWFVTTIATNHDLQLGDDFLLGQFRPHSSSRLLDGLNNTMNNYQKFEKSFSFYFSALHIQLHLYFVIFRTCVLFTYFGTLSFLCSLLSSHKPHFSISQLSMIASVV
jgi:hypothetical protein